MNRLFGKKKKKVKEQAPENPAEPFNLDKANQEIGLRANETTRKLEETEKEIIKFMKQYKSTGVSSQKQYLKGRIVMLQRKRKHLEQQLKGQMNRQMVLDQVKFNKETIDETANMAKFMKETNKVTQQAMKQVDYDEYMDNIEDMQEMAYENQQINDMLTDNYAMDFEEDFDAELENLENELALDEMMNVGQKSKVNQEDLLK